MKERYFTFETIDEKSRAMLDGLARPEVRPELSFDPASAALLVLDMQRYFLEEGSHAWIPSAAPIVERIALLAEAFRAAGMPVFFTRHLNMPENASMMKAWWADLITEDDETSNIIDGLAGEGAMIIRKSQYDAFHGTDLEERLRAKGIKQVVVTGVMTHLCCETTARSAFMRGFAVFFPVDGTATYNERFHRASLVNLSHGFAVPVLVCDLVKSFEGDKA
jgi:isochorismate hydrolase